MIEVTLRNFEPNIAELNIKANEDHDASGYMYRNLMMDRDQGDEMIGVHLGNELKLLPLVPARDVKV